MKITTALISVSDKTGIVEFGKFLADQGVEILSTGGTAAALKADGIEVREIAEYTGFPEILDGRVKTLNPIIHAGILARRDNLDHLTTLSEDDIMPIDLVVVNLYPFETVASVHSGEAASDFETCIENIDIGGVTLIRAAAKNHEFVTVISDPLDYDNVKREMFFSNNETSSSLRKHLATKAFTHTAAYDTAISTWFQNARTI